jgi:uncharacterized membrane protein
MDFSVSEWLNLAFRWIHVFAGIMWVGTTYYFTWLDGQLRAAERRGSQVWMVHSGGFYTVQKHASLGVAAGELHWFRWEAAITWLSGIALLVVVYYAGGALLESPDGPISNLAAVGMGVGAILAGKVIYEALVRSPLGRSDIATAIAGLVLIVAVAAAMKMAFSGRATYMHVGAIFGTIMASNVWDTILPAQRKMIAAAARGEAIDPALGTGAKLRSKHNTFLAVPTVFIMISNHFPIATYGSRYSIAVLGAMVLVGWVAAGWIRKDSPFALSRSSQTRPTAVPPASDR